ncbi:MAG: trehalose-phosphatase [Omnitrophica bacterium RIFCSPLOWO2_01_FULL_50_24]|nr:MAG: trehalose-phosphatase [Omnitrophica bacterium RIFCSPLOWO2_01_FULL_50_24]
MPRHLFDAWEEIAPDFRERYVMLFLDYDGTLTPMTELPESARLTNRMKKLLSELVLMEDISLAIVSGRSLEQLKRFIGVSGLLYVGNHGFEIEGPSIRYTHSGAVEAKGFMQDIAALLKTAFSSVQGIFIENKTFTLSIHYRQVPEDKVDRTRMIFLKTIHPFLDKAQAIFTEGKKVLEVRPALGWNKGTAVTWLYRRSLAANPSRDILPVYVGDDRTDEAAFHAMKDCGLGVKVAENTPDSHAGYYLRTPDEIYDFLRRVQKLKGGVN